MISPFTVTAFSAKAHELAAKAAPNKNKSNFFFIRCASKLHVIIGLAPVMFLKETRPII